MRVINARRAMTLSRLGTGLTGERSALFDWSREGSLIDMIRSASGSRHGLFVAVPQPLVMVRLAQGRMVSKDRLGE